MDTEATPSMVVTAAPRTAPRQIRTKTGDRSRYMVAPGPDHDRYQRTFRVTRYRDAEGAECAVMPLFVYQVADAYPVPVVIGSTPDAPPLPAYVLDRVSALDALEDVRESLPKGSTVYTISRTPMGSGPAHLLDVYALVDNKPHYLTGLVARALGYPMRRDCLQTSGGGMDLGYEVAYRLACALYNDGYALNHAWL
jgi:hypothetical protein